MAYADFDFYANEYYGQSVNESSFHRLAIRASSYLDYYTQGRAVKNPELRELKMACCALADQYQVIEQAQALANKNLSAAMESDGGEVQSETVGSWSKSYRSGGDSAGAAASVASNAQASLAAVARQYLAGTGLLYRGRRCGK